MFYKFFLSIVLALFGIFLVIARKGSGGLVENIEDHFTSFLMLFLVTFIFLLLKKK